MRKRQDRSAIGYVWAAIGLPFLLGMTANVTAAHGQTTGLVAPMSGDCTTSATGAVVCTRTNGVALANSATTDTTNAANITGTLPVAQVPVLTGAKLPAGAPGTVTTYNAAGVQAPAIAAPYAGTVGPIKVAPFSVSAPTSAGTLIGPFNSSSYRVVSLTNGARLLTSGQVTQAKTYIANTTGATALYFELWRVNASGTFNLVCRSQNLLSSVTNNALNTFAITSTCNAQAGDYPAMLEVGQRAGDDVFGVDGVHGGGVSDVLRERDCVAAELDGGFRRGHGGNDLCRVLQRADRGIRGEGAGAGGPGRLKDAGHSL